ncbi:MAG: DNA-3-methyladenine glycosylase I [Ardenticatenaceae bacterium]|nr:DNA-3-methyladenine glycosylase I [Ardenticatenaceae bacterium]
MTYQPQIPPQAVPENDAGYFEKITQAVFQSGFSWEVIRNKWPNFKKAFADFDIEKVAAFDDHDIERLVQDKSIVRNGRKIEATIKNARLCRDLIAEHGSFPAYLRSMDALDYYAREKKFCKQFKFMGPMGAFFFFYSVGENVPAYDEWRAVQDSKKK